MGSTLKVVVTAETSGMTKGMADSARIAQSGAASINAALANVRKGAEGVTGAMAAFAKEQRSQGRVFGFYARELGGIAGAATGTQQAMSGLMGTIADLATGSIIGAAIGAAGLLAQAWGAWGDDASKASEKVAAKILSLNELIAQQTEELRKRNFMLAGGGEHEYEAKRSSAPEEQQVAALRARIAEMESYRATDAGRMEYEYMAANAVQSPLEKAREELRGLERYLEYVKDQAADLDGKVRGIEKFRGMGQQPTAFITSSEVAAEDEIGGSARKKATEDAKAYQAAFQKASREFSVSAWQTSHGVTGEAGSTIAGQGGVYALQQRTQAARDLAAQNQPHALNLMNQMGGQGPRFDPEALKKINDEQEARVKKLRDQYQKLGEVGGQALADLATGHKTVGEVASEVGRQVLAEGAKLAITSIMNSAFKAGGEAAASQAAIPVVGPGLAASAMTAMVTLVSGLAGSVISAEGGADMLGMRGNLPRGGFWSINHPDEMTLDAGLSSWVRKAARRDAEGGAWGGGSGPVNVTIQALDGADVERVLRRGGRGVGRALADLGRKGLL